MTPEHGPRKANSNNPAVFATTHWSVVLAAGEVESPRAAEALEKLCRTYWYPLYAHVRHRGQSPTDAQDLTQGFFERLLEKQWLGQVRRERGRFRFFLLTALNHFLADEWDRSQRLKRGGGREFISLDAKTAEERYQLEPVDTRDPAQLFDHRWAMAVLETALEHLSREFASAGKGELFNRARGFLSGERGERTYASAAAELGLSEAALKMAVTRMRQRCRELIREEIAHTVTTLGEVEDEYRVLLAALSG